MAAPDSYTIRVLVDVFSIRIARIVQPINKTDVLNTNSEIGVSSTYLTDVVLLAEWFVRVGTADVQHIVADFRRHANIIMTVALQTQNFTTNH